ncbi:MAG: hypothetical protein FWH00_01605, partial [Oscillospiraceae bacterium]|nr:hypothetical protein [Oscillospiraceae bacterium]
GMASYSEEDGASIWDGGKGKLLQKVGAVTAEGDVYYTRGNGGPDLFTQGRIKKGKSKKAEEIRIGRVEVTQGGIGIAYDLSGAEAGKVVNAGELANVYAGAMLALVINHDATNAPYSHSYGGFFTPAPPCAAPVPSRDERPARERKDAPSGIKKLLKFLIK